VAFRFRPDLFLTVAAVLALAVLVRLGVWQLDRLAWKNELIATVETHLSAPAVPLGDLLDRPGRTVEALAFRPATVTGRFDHEREIHLYARNDEGMPGYRILTPLDRSSGPPILVDRGFVPTDYKARARRPGGLVTGEQQISGILRRPVGRGFFTPETDLADNIWFALEPFSAVRDFVQRPALLPVIFEAAEQPNLSALPRGGPLQVEFKNDHLGYALTWFGLALTLIGVYVAYHVQTGRLQLRRR